MGNTHRDDHHPPKVRTRHGAGGAGGRNREQPGARPPVVLVDDHDLFRTGLRTPARGAGRLVVGEAPDRRRRVARVREHAPDVVVMDINMPVIERRRGDAGDRRLAPLTRVVVLTISDDDGDVIDAIVAGACGYLLKDASIDELIRGIDAAAAGDVADLPVDRRRRSSSGCARAARRGRRPTTARRALRTRARRPPPDRERQGQRPHRRASCTSARRRSRTTSRTSS